MIRKSLSKSLLHRADSDKKGENQVLMEKVQSVNRSMNIPRHIMGSNEEEKRLPETLKLHINGVIESGKVSFNIGNS